MLNVKLRINLSNFTSRIVFLLPTFRRLVRFTNPCNNRSTPQKPMQNQAKVRMYLSVFLLKIVRHFSSPRYPFHWSRANDLSLDSLVFEVANGRALNHFLLEMLLLKASSVCQPFAGSASLSLEWICDRCVVIGFIWR